MAVKGKRKAEVELTLVDKMGASLAAAKKRLGSFAASMPKKMASSVLGGVKSTAGSLLQGIGMSAGMGITSMFSSVIDTERALTRLQLASNSSDQKMGEFRSSVMATSNELGVSRDELIRGAAAYVAFTGDAAGAQNAMASFGKISVATGASMDDIAAAAGSLNKNLKIDPSQFIKAFDVLNVQGKMGSVEIKDLASELSNIAPQFAKFGQNATGVVGMAKMGAAMQAMRSDFGNVSETATGFKGIMTQIVKNADKLKKKGVNVFDKQGNPRDFLDIVNQFGEAQDKGKIMYKDMFANLGEAKAVSAMQSLIDRRSEVQKMISDSAESNSINKDAAKFQESAAGKIDKAWTSIKNKIAEALTPERIAALSSALVKAADLFASLVDTVAKIIGFISDHLPNYEQAMAQNTPGQDKNAKATGEYSMQKLQSMGRSPEQARAETYAYLKQKAKDLGGGLTNDPDKDAASNAFNSAAFGYRPNQTARKPATWNGSMAPASSAMFGMPQQPIKLEIKIGENTFAEAMSNSMMIRRKPGFM